MRCYKRHLYHFLFTLLFLLIFLKFSVLFKCSASAQDYVRLGKVGEWNNNYGDFRAVDVKEINGVTYAFCATSRGMAVYRIHYENAWQNRTKAEVSFLSFVPLGDCTDIVIEERGGFEKDLYAYITEKNKGLFIRDVSNPAFSYHVGTCDTPGSADGVAISESGEYAFVADYDRGLQIIDISDKEGPVIVGACDTPGYARGVAISGEYAFVAAGGSGLQVIDISDSTGPVIVGSCYTPGYARGVAISGEYAFVAAGGSGLQVIHIIDPTGPSIVGSCYTPGTANGVAISELGEYAFVADGRSGLQVIQISDPTGPWIVGICDTPRLAQGVVISGDYAIVADDSSGLQVIDISDPTGPFIVGTCDTPWFAQGVAVSGEYAFVADWVSGLQVIQISDPTEPLILGNCNTPGWANGVAISGDYAIVADDSSGLQVIDISDPTGLSIVGSCDTPGRAFGVAISGDYAFVVDGYSGLLVIDINDPTGPFIVGKCDTPGWANGVAISKSGDYAFVAVGRSGLQVIDISDPTRPSIVGSCDTPADALGVAVSESGDYAFVAYSELEEEGGLLVIDISDPTGPSIVGRCYTPGDARGVAIAESGDYAFVADDKSGLQVIDISDPTKPSIVGSCYTYGRAFGVAISGDYAFVADYDRGLQAIDISDPTGPCIVGRCYTPGDARGVAIAESGDYAFVADDKGGLKVIDISNPTGPSIVGSCDTPGRAFGVALSESEDYAFVADYDRGLQVIHINNPTGPFIIGSCDTPGDARGVAIAESGDYAFVADGDSGLQVIDISNPTRPSIVANCYTPGDAQGVALSESGDYAFVVDGDSGLQVIDISNPTGPSIIGRCNTSGWAFGVTISESGDYAFVADGNSGLQVIDICNPTGPFIVGSCDTPGSARGVVVSESGDYAFVADGNSGLLKLKINIGPPPKGKGNLILVAGGNINYKVLSHKTTNAIMRKRGCTLDPFASRASYWQITQALANYVFNTFRNSGYEIYDIYYFNPEPLQDTDNDGIFNQLVVDDPYPTREGLINIIKQFPEDRFGHHLANNGPLYIYLLGHAAQDRFLIAPNEVITAQDLSDAIDKFRNGYTDNKGTYHPGTNRQVVIIIESAASGTFIDDLAGPDITVITSTDDGASYIKPDLSDSNNIPYNSFTKAFMDALGPHLDPSHTSEDPPETLHDRINDLLKLAFITARNKLKEWALAGQPFAYQAPQMALPEIQFTSFKFSEDGINHLLHLTIDSFQDIPYELTVIGLIHNYFYTFILQDMAFFSSDKTILDPESTEDIQITYIPYSIPLYSITPKKNGRISLIAHPAEETYPHHLLSARITIDVSINDPDYFQDTGRMAIIVAGYKGTEDYLWESTNHIANHAYKTLLAMEYTGQEIHYYNPSFLQDTDENGIYDDIDGYPKSEIFDPDTDPNSPYAAFSKIHNPNTKTKELFLFLVGHGTNGAFCLNPSAHLQADYLIDQIETIAEKVSDKIIFVYDASYSGGFLAEIEKRSTTNDTLSKKLITITSTDPNQMAYFLNQGLISFSYPFFSEWFLTGSLMDAFYHATGFLPVTNQTPCISDPALVRLWDLERIYYKDESRPIIEDVKVYRSKGKLHVSADVYSLAGISKVWAIVESIRSPQSPQEIAVTQAPGLYLSLDSNDLYADSNPYGGEYILTTPDPFPNETNYIIHIYALDRSESQKKTSYKTAVGNPIAEETIALITDCSARVKNNNLKLSLNAHPDIDERDFIAWVILKSSPSSMVQNTMIVDLFRDPNNTNTGVPNGQENPSGPLYVQEIPYNPQYLIALFLVEGRRQSEETTRTEWQEVPIIQSPIDINADPFEPDDDPNVILLDKRHEIIINAPSKRHTFYNEYTDWSYFYALEGFIYEIYAQDTSEYDYFIQLALYDPNIRPIQSNGNYLTANNYLTFPCARSGYYLLRITLASGYPPEGVEYIISVVQPSCCQEVHFEMNLPVGWGMISLPVIPESPVLSDLFPEGVVVYGYKKGSGYVRIKMEEELEAGKGYWMLLNNAQNLLFTGQPIYGYPLSFSQDGWDMIGGCTYPARASADNCAIDTIYKYVPGSGYQRPLETDLIEPGKGYWILCSDISDHCEIKVEAENP